MTTKSTAKSAVMYACQKCYAPLKLHESFSDMNRHLYEELSAPFNFEKSLASEIVLPISNLNDPYPKKVIPPNSNTTSELVEFSSDEVFSNPSYFSQRLKVCAYLFDYLSGRTEMDHPLCQDCADALLNAQDISLKQVEEEMTALQRYLDYLNTMSAPEEADSASKTHQRAGSVESRKTIGEEESEPVAKETVEDGMKKELSQLEAEEEELKLELKALMEEEGKLDKDLVSESELVSQHQKEVERLTCIYNEKKHVLIEDEDELSALKVRLHYAHIQLGRLSHTNVLNLAFNIWYEGHMGLINGLRLGRLPINPVEWPEISAAWGQCVLLLKSLEHKMNFTFKNYRLVPMGSTSSIVNLSDGKEYPLYYVGGIRWPGETKFDTGMVAYLDCVSQMQSYVESKNQIKLPYIIDRGKLIERSSKGQGQAYSIKFYHSKSEEDWTKALKYLLITLKWLLVYLVTQQTITASSNSTT